MLSTFSPPMKGVNRRDSLPRFFIAVMYEPDVGAVLMAVDMNGEIEWVPIEDVTVDWRYDPKTGIWDDPTSQPDPAFGDNEEGS